MLKSYADTGNDIQKQESDYNLSWIKLNNYIKEIEEKIAQAFVALKDMEKTIEETQQTLNKLEEEKDNIASHDYALKKAELEKFLELARLKQIDQEQHINALINQEINRINKEIAELTRQRELLLVDLSKEVGQSLSSIKFADGTSLEDYFALMSAEERDALIKDFCSDMFKEHTKSQSEREALDSQILQKQQAIIVNQDKINILQAAIQPLNSYTHPPLRDMPKVSARTALFNDNMVLEIDIKDLRDAKKAIDSELQQSISEKLQAMIFKHFNQKIGPESAKIVAGNLLYNNGDKLKDLDNIDIKQKEQERFKEKILSGNVAASAASLKI